jgi:hypothetical protein
MGMEREPSTRDNIAAHVRAATRPGSESQRLLRDLGELCWPGGVDDRTEPVARGWLSLAGPQLLTAEMPVCRCAEHRCQICN